MKKLALAMLLFIAFSAICLPQSNIRKIRVTDHRQNAILKTYQVFKIDTLKRSANDPRFTKARNQEGVIGNDFFGDKKIGFAVGKNSWYDVTDYHPVDGYKRTFCGKLKEYACRNAGSSTFDLDIPVIGTNVYSQEIDDDFQIYITVNENDPLLVANKERVLKLLDNFSYDPYNVIEGEIDIHQSHKKNFLLPGHKIPPSQSQVCLYGAWVAEVVGTLNNPIPGKEHKNNHEIHPAEQFWWKDGNNEYVNYNLVLAVDNSGKFNERSDFYTLQVGPQGFENALVEPWGKGPMNGVFAIPFQVDLSKKEKAVFSITGSSFKNVKGLANDTRTHFLIRGRDTIAYVKENNFDELVNIDFFNVGSYDELFDRPGQKNVLVRGFLLIRSKIDTSSINVPPLGRIRDYAGHLKLEVRQWNTSESLRQSGTITFESITRLENNSYRGINANTNNVRTLFSPNPVPPGFDENDFVLELRKGGESQGIKIPVSDLAKGQSFNLNSRTFSWEGFITDTYSFFAKCDTKSGAGGYPLGELQVGIPPTRRRRAATEKTILHFQINSARRVPPSGDQSPQSETENIDINIFEIAFRTKQN